MNNREAFESWWSDFKSTHEEWPFADKEALLLCAYQAGLASQAQQPTVAKPYGYVTTLRNGTKHFYESMPYLDNAVKCDTVYMQSQAQQTTGAKPYGYAVEESDGEVKFFSTFDRPAESYAFKVKTRKVVPLYTSAQAQQESQVIRKAFICPACECVYADSPVSHCDCFENHSNTYIEGSIIYTPAPEVCSDGKKCGAGGYCITCPNMPAPEGE